MFRCNEHEDEMAIVAVPSEENLTEHSDGHLSIESRPLPSRNYGLAQRDKLSQGTSSVYLHTKKQTFQIKQIYIYIYIYIARYTTWFSSLRSTFLF